MRRLLASVSLSVLTAVAARAETAAPTPEQVVVTGARARSHTRTTTTVPVDVYGGPELQQALRTGEVGQALQNLSPSVTLPRQSASGTSDTVRVVQVRGLPPDETLVLVDGKRWHPTAVPDTEGLFRGSVPVDINSIPFAMIDHIELLRDGAGAQYGSDAIAGVVNIVLDHRKTGGSISLGFGTNWTSFEPTNRRITDGQTGTASITWGTPIGNGGYIRVGADGVASAGTNRAGRSNAYWTSYYATDADVALNNQVLFKSGDPAYQKGDLFYTAAHPLGNGWEAYSFGTYDFRHAEGAAFFRFPGDPQNNLAVYPNGYRPITASNSFDVGFVGGVRYTVADPWTFDISVKENANSFRYGVRNSLNASLGEASPRDFRLATFFYNSAGLNVDATRELDIGLPAPVNLAIGTEYVHETYETGAGDRASYAAGPITVDGFGSSVPPGAQAGPGLRPSDAVSLNRDYGGIYAEAETALTERFTLNLAGRFVDYGGTGTAGIGKISGRYALWDGLSLRGSFSNSYRAPALAQTGFRFASLNFNADGTGLQNNVLVPPTDPLARAVGAQPLKPETSLNYSAGIAWALPRRTVLTVDGYYIQVDHRITRSSDLYVTTDDPSVQSIAFLTNALDTTNRGVDVTVSNEMDLAGGTLKLSGALNMNKITIDRVRAPSPLLQAQGITSLFDSADLLRVRAGTPSSKVILTSVWSNDRFNALLRATRYGSMYTNSFDDTARPQDGVPAQSFTPKWLIDLEGTVNVTPAWAFTVGGNNIFDVYPTRTLRTDNATYGGALPYNFINPIGINGAYYYTRMTYKF